MKHEIRSRSLVRISCACGWTWRNEALKGKDDLDLALEAENAFKAHVRQMRKEGF